MYCLFFLSETYFVISSCVMTGTESGLSPSISNALMHEYVLSFIMLLSRHVISSEGLCVSACPSNVDLSYIYV